MRIIFWLFMSVISTQAFADAAIPEVEVRDVLGDDIWQRAQKYFYQTIFNKLADLDLKLHAQDNFRWDLHIGRILLRQSPTRLMLADHFGIIGQGGVPTAGGLLTFGGYLSTSLLRIREVNDSLDAIHQPTLDQSLSDWDPHHQLENTETFQQNIEPWIANIEADVKAGNTEAAKQMFGDDIPEKKYLDLLAGLKIPFEMPWTSKRLLDEKKFHTGDLASFAALGGIFARMGGESWGNIQAPWVGLFLRGQFRFGILKTEAKKALLRVESMKEHGWDYNLFNSRFQITIGHGMVFGNKIQPSFRPINISGTSYDSRLFARTYELKFDFAGVSAAYDAAVHGNLTVLDDMAKLENSGVKVLSERYTEGHYKQSQLNFNFGPISFDNSYMSSNLEKNFWDERGTFTLFSAAATRASYDDANIGIAQVRRTRTNDLTAEAYTLSPQGPFPPRAVWEFEEVNFAAKPKDQAQLRAFIESLKPSGLFDSNKRVDQLTKYTQYRAAFHLEAHPAGVAEFEEHTPDQVWQAAAKVLFNDSSVWQDDKARHAWRMKNIDIRNYLQVQKWAEAFKTTLPPDQVANRFDRLLKWQRSTAWDALGVRLFLQLISPANRYMKLDFVPATEGDTFHFENGTADYTAYPDDWEYLNIPDVIPHP